MILVDSTKYISWMRAGRNPLTVLEAVLRSRSLVSCGVIRIEVLRGIVKPRVKAQIAELFDTIPEIPIDDKVLADAVETAWQLDRQGRVLPVTDLLIASCARRVGASIVSEDPHFTFVPDLTVSRDLN